MSNMRVWWISMLVAVSPTLAIAQWNGEVVASACANGVNGEVCDTPSPELWLDSRTNVSSGAHAHKTDAWDSQGTNGSTNDASSFAIFNPTARSWGANTNVGSSGVGGVIGTIWADAHAHVELNITDHFLVTEKGLQAGDLIFVDLNPVQVDGKIDGESSGYPKPTWDSTVSYSWSVSSSEGHTGGLFLESKDSTGFHNLIQTGPDELEVGIGEYITVSVSMTVDSNSDADNYVSEWLSQETFASTNADFGHTFRWGGISSIRLASTGESLQDYTLTSDSGVQWNLASSVPESSIAYMFLVGLILLLFYRRRSDGKG